MSKVVPSHQRPCVVDSIYISDTAVSICTAAPAAICTAIHHRQRRQPSAIEPGTCASADCIEGGNPAALPARHPHGGTLPCADSVSNAELAVLSRPSDLSPQASPRSWPQCSRCQKAPASERRFAVSPASRGAAFWWDKTRIRSRPVIPSEALRPLRSPAREAVSPPATSILPQISAVEYT
jgi:hypothetical protein